MNSALRRSWRFPPGSAASAVRGWRPVALLVPLLVPLLAGCAAWTEQDLAARTRALASDGLHREARERAMQQQWIGRTRQELLDAMGTPHLVMGVPGRRWPDAMVLVYRGRDAVGGCIDAFVVHRLDHEPIANYFCR